MDTIVVPNSARLAAMLFLLGRLLQSGSIRQKLCPQNSECFCTSRYGHVDVDHRFYKFVYI